MWCSTFETFAHLNDSIGHELGMAFLKFLYISFGSIAIGIVMGMLFSLVRFVCVPYLLAVCYLLVSFHIIIVGWFDLTWPVVWYHA